MIWRLTYCNKKGVEARVDIIKGDKTSVEVVQGSANPFTLSYKLDKNDKSGHIMTSSADIEIFETETFNIDKLKTSNETELKVEYFEGNVLTWSGFILPDFFSREIGSPNIVRMTASDRLTALKGVTLSDLPIRVSLRDLIELCLEQTGLDLALVAQVQINQGSTNILDSEILSQRLTDTRGRSISCYDILMSIMVATNSTIRQREGQWIVYNKLEHELRTPTIFFDKVERGAIRTIQPVASSVGVYKEFGGSKTYPENYNFKSGGVGWTVNFPEEMSASFSSNNILGFDVLTSGGGYQPVYGDETNNPHAVIYGFRGPLNYLKSEDIPVPSGYTNEVDIKLDINASAPIWNFGSHQRVSVFAVKGEQTQVLTSNGFVDISKSSESEYMHMLQFEAGVVLAGELARVDTDSLAISGKLSDSEGLDGYSVHIRLYSSDRAYATIINFASINFAPTGDNPKGDLYKTTQGSNFTKQHDVETTIFGDYITSGLNGYFYKYPIDDTSNLFLPNGELTSPAWATIFDTTKRPLLHHISRQKSRLFSVAHDILRANINVESFDPLAVFQDCKGGKYVIVSANFDFLRSEVDVELEQIAYDNEIFKRDFIYSYFGEGESNIKSIGGIAGGGGGTGGSGGGGMTPEQLEMLTNLASWWKLDEDNDAIYSEKSVYSLKGVSALGLGDGGSGGGYDRLDKWVDYDSSKSGWVLSALLGYDLHTRVNDLEASAGDSNIDIEITGSGNAVTDVSKSGNTLTFDKGNTFALSTHNHVIANITGLQDALDGKEPAFTKNTAFNKNFGTTAGTVAQGNDSRIINGQTAYGWGDHAGLYPTLSAFNNHANNSVANQKHLSDTQLAYLNNLISWWKLDEDGNLYTEKNLYSTKGVSALGLGDGGSSGGGGVDMLQSWDAYTSDKADYYVPASLLVSFRSDTSDRLAALESGSATLIDTTGSGNAITSVSKSGNLLTFNKGLTFSLSTHNHDAIYKPIGYVPSWSEITDKPSTFAPSSHTHTIANVTGLQGALDGKEPAFTKNTAFNKNFGTTAGTVAQGNDSRIINGQTAYGWGNHASAGYALNSALSNYLPLTGGTLTGNVTAPTFQGSIKTTSGVEYLNSTRVHISEVGWYRVFTSNVPNDFGSSVILNVNRRYNFGNNESYTFSINVVYGSGISITQLSGRANIRYIPKIRVDYVNQGVLAVDIYYNYTSPNEVSISGSGTGKFQAPVLVAAPTGTTVEFDTVNGVKSNLGFIGALTGNASSATKLQTARTIAGVSFDGTANIAIPFANLSSKPTTLSGYGITDASNSNHTHGLNRHNLSAPGFIDTLTTSNFRTTLFGNAASGSNISTARWQTTPIALSGLSSYGTMMAWSASDTQGFLALDYYNRGAIVGGGSGDNILWTATLLHSSNYNSYAPTKTGTGASGTWGINITGNASSATKLQTARTIWGQSFNGTGNVTGALSGATTIAASISVTSPKIIFNAAGWSLEQVGTELQIKHNGVIKQRMLSNGTILATGGITALST